MNLSITDKIKKAIDLSIKELSLDGVEYSLEHPTEISYGDYATNVAMVISKKDSKSPTDIAQTILEAISKQAIPEIDKVEIAGPGFINFSLSKEFYQNSLNTILKQGEKFGQTDLYKNKKILIEHSSPNLFKPFHIGHLVNNAVGESIKRLLQNSGAKVTTISYPSDVSLGIAKAIWGAMQKGASILDSDSSMLKKINFLGDAYVLGTKEFDEDEKVKLEVRDINKQIYENIKGEALNIYKKGRELTLEYFENMVEKLGSKFDGYIFESEAGEEGMKLVEANTKTIFEESNGAIIFAGEKFDLHTRVFVNKYGFPTYEAKDLGLLKKKFDRYKPDLSVFVTDHEQKEYFKVVLKAAEQIKKEWAEKTKHVVHGRLNFAEEKISSRFGNVPLAEDVLQTVNNKVLEKNQEINSEKIAIGAIKFSILKSALGKNIIFDMDKSISFEGDSGPYLQYTYARTQSLLRKGKEEKISAYKKYPNEITNVEKLLYRFPEITEKATTEYAPHLIISYLLELAREFNSWYGNTQIVDNKDEFSGHKLAITKATGEVIKKGLNLLGIETLERM